MILFKYPCNSFLQQKQFNATETKVNELKSKFGSHLT
jgi:hypothetical protein